MDNVFNTGCALICHMYRGSEHLRRKLYRCLMAFFGAVYRRGRLYKLVKNGEITSKSYTRYAYVKGILFDTFFVQVER